MATHSPDSSQSPAAGGTLSVELNPPRVEIEPGGPPVEVTVALRNLSNVVEQYTLEISGLDADWYTAPVTSVSLFPQDSDQVRITLHPPKRPGVRAGSYPFRVIARARSGTAESSGSGTLELRGVAIYRILDLAPRRQTARGKGTYRLQLSNTGAADVRLGLEGRDTEDACTFSFPKHAEPLVAAGSKGEYPVVVRPKKRPWVGPPRSYDFTISVRPLDARGEPQTIAGQFTHQPLFRTLPILPVLKWLLILAVLLALLVAAFATGTAQEFGRRTAIVKAEGCSHLADVPLLGSLCGPGVAAPDKGCSFEFGFQEFAAAEPQMVGACTTNVVYDKFGNGLQYTQKGVLFWLKESNTVYFFSGDSVYVFVQGKTRLIDGSGRPVS
jgi:hypothetical protein